MYCSKCGIQNPHDAIFCIKCGAKIDDDYKERIAPKTEERLVKVAYISYGKCSKCNEKVTNEAVCPKCNSPLEFPLKKKNTLTACLLSLIIPGLGNMYAGYWMEGIGFFVVGVLIGLYDVINGTSLYSIIFRLIAAGRAGVNVDNVNQPEKHIKMKFDGNEKSAIETKTDTINQSIPEKRIATKEEKRKEGLYQLLRWIAIVCALGLYNIYIGTINIWISLLYIICIIMIIFIIKETYWTVSE
jgi:TM2 domain-containing membrane protein YozV